MLEHMRGLAARARLGAGRAGAPDAEAPLPADADRALRRSGGATTACSSTRGCARTSGSAPSSSASHRTRCVSEGTVAELEEWCGLEFPESGELRRRGRARAGRDRPRARPTAATASRTSGCATPALRTDAAPASVPAGRIPRRGAGWASRRGLPGRSCSSRPPCFVTAAAADHGGRRTRSHEPAAAAAADRQHPQRPADPRGQPRRRAVGGQAARRRSTDGDASRFASADLVIAGTNNTGPVTTVTVSLYCAPDSSAAVVHDRPRHRSRRTATRGSDST